jgi:hypothetical protein
MMHPLTKLAWLFVGGTIALAIIWALNNAEPEVQLACKQTDTSDRRPRRYECVEAQTDEVWLLTCYSVRGGKGSVSLPKKMNLRAIPPNCSELVEEE